MPPRIINVTELIDKRPTNAYQKSIIALCALVAMLDGVDSQMIAPTGPSIAASLHVPPVAMGPIYSAGQFGYLIGALCFGPIADRIGRKSMLVLTAFVFACCTLMTVTAQSFDFLLAVRFVTGLGLGGAAPCFVSLASEYGPKRVRAQIVAFLWAAVPLGGLFGTFAIAFMLPRFGWPSVYYLFGGLTFIVAAVAALIYPLDVRSTGVGWTIAIGRIGAVLGPLSAGLLLAAHWSLVEVFMALAIPALCGAATILLLRLHALRAGGLAGASPAPAIAH